MTDNLPVEVAPVPETAAASLPALSILIVDDSPETRLIYSRYLAQGGSQYSYVITEADTVASGLRALEESTFDCVLLDFRLPDADGLALLSEISDNGGRITTPFIMTTSQGNEYVAVEAMKRGARDYLVKGTFDAQTLTTAVEKAYSIACADRDRTRRTQRLKRLSVTDPLTGLYNRRYFTDQLRIEICRAKRYDTSLCILMIDLDHFKQVNDTYGHVVGDRVLTAFSAMLKRVARTTDVIARLGGEEFCLILTNTDCGGAAHLAERLCLEARELAHQGNDDRSFYVTCSGGLVEADGSESEPEELMHKSDVALYQAKRQRDRYCVYTGGSRQQPDREMGPIVVPIAKTVSTCET